MLLCVLFLVPLERPPFRQLSCRTSLGARPACQQRALRRRQGENDLIVAHPNRRTCRGPPPRQS